MSSEMCHCRIDRKKLSYVTEAPAGRHTPACMREEVSCARWGGVLDGAHIITLALIFSHKLLPPLVNKNCLFCPIEQSCYGLIFQTKSLVFC